MFTKKRILQSLFLCLLIAGTIIIIREQNNKPYQHNSGFVFGTVYNVTYQSDDDLQAEIVKELDKVDASLSAFNQNSTLVKVNNGITDVPDQMLTEVLGLAQNISKQTDGNFDITVAPLVNVWGFGVKNNVVPTKSAIDSLMYVIGYKKLNLVNGKIVKSDPRVQIDCSAIAKGYGVDVIARFLQKKGIENFMVEVGGEIVTRGLSQDRLPWKIGVTKPTDNPDANGNELQTIMNITDKAMATSGNYRNFYYKGGKKYAHTIDPHTGYPVQHSLLSATVFADNCATADAYATAFMVMGMEKAKQVLSRHPELMAYLIYEDANGKLSTWQSPNLKESDKN
jgi:thiamine biosynthesis lipoprotein